MKNAKDIQKRLSTAWDYLMNRWIPGGSMDSWTVERLAAICSMADALKIYPWCIL